MHPRSTKSSFHLRWLLFSWNEGCFHSVAKQKWLWERYIHTVFNFTLSFLLRELNRKEHDVASWVQLCSSGSSSKLKLATQKEKKNGCIKQGYQRTLYCPTLRVLGTSVLNYGAKTKWVVHSTIGNISCTRFRFAHPVDQWFCHLIIMV